MANKLMKLWDMWNIPACILLSLFLQVFLVLFASLRQRSRNSFLRFLICSAYLSADWVAAVTIGLITKFLTDPCHPRGKEDLYTFWVSFLLLHLGGPDSITSFAIEDNELWRRHFFGLILRVVAAVYCFFLTLANSKLWLPTILVFVVGTVKYAERTVALYLASTDHFGATALPNKSIAGAVVNNNPNAESVVDDDMVLLMIAYDLFGKFKGLIAGYSLAFEQILESIKYFQGIRSSKMGFKLIENELGFLYEVFHTKVCVVGSRIGLIFRLSSFCFIVGAFIVFHFVLVDNYKNHEFGGFEVSVTYALLIGAVGLDIISGIGLTFSDWILASNYYGFERHWRKYIPRCFWKRSRWCGSVPQYNIIDYFLHESWLLNTKLPGCLKSVVDNIKVMLFSSSKYANEHLKRFIFDELKAASFQTHVTDEAWWRKYLRFEQESAVVKAREHVNYTIQFTFDVVSLHLATEICYQLTGSEKADERKESNNCKVISDYMFYLLIMEPAMLAPVAMKDWHKKLEKIFAEVKQLFLSEIEYRKLNHHEACDELYEVMKKNSERNGHHVLSKAYKIAVDFSRDEDWGKMISLWVVLLCTGAFNCRPILHAQQPSRGGELLTFTWLLAKHFALDSTTSYVRFKDITSHFLNQLWGQMN